MQQDNFTLIPDLVWEKLNQNFYYLIAAGASVVALFVLPLMGSTAGLKLNLPDTTAGWVVFGITRLAVAVLNMLLFHCFVQQGRINILKDERYVRAREKGLKLSLDTIREAENRQPRSPKQYYKEIYGKKSIMVFAASLLSAVALSQAVLTFDWISMITYFTTILCGVVCGILQMKDTENFWTIEYNQYLAEQELLLQEKESDNDN